MTATLARILQELTPAQQKQVEDFARSIASRKDESSKPDRYLDPRKWSRDNPDLRAQFPGMSAVEIEDQINEQRADDLESELRDVPD
jgi:hypothetical protein